MKLQWPLRIFHHTRETPGFPGWEYWWNPSIDYCNLCVAWQSAIFNDFTPTLKQKHFYYTTLFCCWLAYRGHQRKLFDSLRPSMFMWIAISSIPLSDHLANQFSIIRWWIIGTSDWSCDVFHLKAQGCKCNLKVYWQEVEYVMVVIVKLCGEFDFRRYRWPSATFVTLFHAMTPLFSYAVLYCSISNIKFCFSMFCLHIAFSGKYLYHCYL